MCEKGKQGIQTMREVKEVDIYVDGEKVLENLTFNYEPFDMDSDEPQSITATAFLPSDDYYREEKELVIDFKDGIFAKARVYMCMRLGDEFQSDMVILGAGHSLAEVS
jgi:hypothetical protein